MDERLVALNRWLKDDLGYRDYRLAPASSDASFRRYFRMQLTDGTYIVMDAPPAQEDCRPFIDISERLKLAGVNVPDVYARDMQNGFLLLRDLGTDLYLDILGADTADKLYRQAIDALLTMQAKVQTGGLPVYNETLLREEMLLFSHWLLDRHLQSGLDRQQAAEFENLQRILIDSAGAQQQVFVHRDYHSRNLLVNDRTPGIIDYQDAVLGPLSYDLVSLLKDCYVRWSREEIDQWLQYYHAGLSEVLARPVSLEGFRRQFDLMGVQRHLKASGIFARLFHRDGKQAYLGDIPRTLSYIVDLARDYPELSWLAVLIEEKVVPRLQKQ